MADCRFASPIFRSKHITAHDKCARIKNSVYFFLMPMLLRLRKHPTIQQVRIKAISKRLFKTLIMPRGKAVKRNR